MTTRMPAKSLRPVESKQPAAKLVIHLRAIIAAKASGRPLELTLKGEDNSQWTFVRPLNYPGVLAELVKELPLDLPLRAAKIHTATDGQLVIDTFEFGQGEPFDPHDPDQALKLEQTMGYAALNLPQWSADRVRDYFHRCTADYVLTLTPLRMCSRLVAACPARPAAHQVDGRTHAEPGVPAS